MRWLVAALRWLALGRGGAPRIVALSIPPLLGGMLIYARFLPRVIQPMEERIQHPPLPEKYRGLSNPLRNPSDADVERFIAGGNFGRISVSQARKLLVERYTAEGRLLYMKSCAHCHGAKADGAGPMARALRLKPTNFADRDAMAAISEPYFFWRTKEGGVGLPPEATPWNSAMPAWDKDLTDEEIWKIALAVYEMAAAGQSAQGGSRVQYDDEALARKKIPASDEMLRLGQHVYRNWCIFCHGERGDGNGPLADYLDPRPRSFTQFMFKFRTTATSELPTDEDLFRTISLGVPGTSMPAWGEGSVRLSERERWAAVHFIKTFNPNFDNKAFDPYASKILNYGKIAERKPTPESIRRGKLLYESESEGGGCIKCHGLQGRGDGRESGTHKDDSRLRILPADLTKGWRLKNWGRAPADIFRTISTGLNGTPMPSYFYAFSEEDRWALTHYVSAFVQQENLTNEIVISARRVKGRLPLDPDDALWRQVRPFNVPLAGQLIAKPRLLNHSVDLISVRALYDDQQIAFHLTWNDRFKNTTHREPEMLSDEELKDTLVKLRPGYERLGHFRDAAALQFPVKGFRGRKLPYLLLGERDDPVNLWVWKADLPDGNSVEEMNAEGLDKLETKQPPERQTARGRARFEHGQWRVVMARQLLSDDRQDVQFQVGALVPVAFHIWDGANDEWGLRRSISSWYYVMLEPEVPPIAYIYAVAGAVGVGGLELLFLRWARKYISKACRNST